MKIYPINMFFFAHQLQAPVAEIFANRFLIFLPESYPIFSVIYSNLPYHQIRLLSVLNLHDT